MAEPVLTHDREAPDRPRAPIAVLAFGAFAVGTGLFALNGVLPEAAVDLHVTPAAVGQAVTVFAAVYAVAAPLLAVLGGRFPTRPVLLAALLLLVVGNVVTAASPNLTVLLLSRVISAVGAAAYTPAALGAAAALAGPRRRGAALAIVQGGLNAALGAGVPLGVAVATVLSWRGSLVTVVVLGVLAVLAVLLGTRSLPHAASVRLPEIGELLRRRAMLAALIVTVLVVAAGISAYTYVAAVLAGSVRAHGVVLIVLLVLYGIGALAGTLVAGPLVDRYGPAPVLLLAVAVQAVSLALVPLASVLAAAVPVIAIWGASFTASTPPQQVRLITLAPDSPTVAVSLNSSAIYIGQGLGAVLGGVVLDVGSSAEALPLFAAGVALVGLIAALASIRRHERPSAHTPAP